MATDDGRVAKVLSEEEKSKKNEVARLRKLKLEKEAAEKTVL
jgi:hypothetical protein